MASKKDNYLVKRRIWAGYNSTLSLGIVTIAALILTVINLTLLAIDSDSALLDWLYNGVSLAEFALAIVSNIYNAKIKYSFVASILIYVANVLSVPVGFIAAVGSRMSDTISQSTVTTMLLEMYFFVAIVFVVQIISAVFSFRTANKIKKDFPNARQDYIDARKSRNV